MTISLAAPASVAVLQHHSVSMSVPMVRHVTALKAKTSAVVCVLAGWPVEAQHACDA